ncbi:hypothetical protein MSAN_00971900 [Mycena sanguinolenta]|uniref:Uncharacterized protein n=1 Tax=Mycena sanguinolenta TaxID=230812 RepID=A0A8H7DBV0_9AGAR|nr:hypothetical protein MSAN_00971900 [Mycena sanguinolenta]
MRRMVVAVCLEARFILNSHHCPSADLPSSSSMALLSRLLAKFGNMLPMGRSLNIEEAPNSSHPEPSVISPIPETGALPDTPVERRSIAAHSSQPDSVIPVNSSMGALDGQVLVDNTNGLILRSPSDRTQSHQTLLTVYGSGHTVGAVSYVAGDRVDTVNNYYIADGQGFDLEGLRPLIENQPKLLRIICVVIAFRVAPSMAQISRVLGLPEDEVCGSIEAIANHLHTPVVFGESITFPPAFVSAVYSSCLPVMSAAHGDIACWCLQGPMSETRHFDYAITYWAWHVSQAPNCVEVTRALQNFRFVLCSVKETQFSNVIHWLKCCKLPEAAPLVQQYENRLRTLMEMPPSER